MPSAGRTNRMPASPHAPSLADSLTGSNANTKTQEINRAHEAIVDAEIFERAQRLLQRKQRTDGTRVRNRSGALLQGMLQGQGHGAPDGYAPSEYEPSEAYAPSDYAPSELGDDVICSTRARADAGV